MTRKLRWTEHAIKQLGAIAEYISTSSPVYAEQVIDSVVTRLDQALDHPQSGRIVPEVGHADVRELIESPYRIVYRVHSSSIEVLSVLHGRQAWRDLP